MPFTSCAVSRLIMLLSDIQSDIAGFRLGGGEMEISTWELPMEIENRKELSSLMAHMKTLWSERILARLAIPEVLEGGDEEASGSIADERVQRTYADVEDVIAKGWPGESHSNIPGIQLSIFMI